LLSSTVIYGAVVVVVVVAAAGVVIAVVERHAMALGPCPSMLGQETDYCGLSGVVCVGVFVLCVAHHGCGHGCLTKG
jgi:hypothetical protein